MILRSSTVVLAGCAAVFLAACGGADAGSEEQDLTSKTIAPGATLKVSTTTKGDAPILLKIDCAPPSDPDSVGPVIRVDAPDLGTSSSDPAHAGYWSFAGEVTPGKHTIAITNAGETTAKCKVTTKTLSSSDACTAWSVRRSPNTHHQHIQVGKDTSGDWEPLPASGNHWGAWAAWGSIYGKPVKRGFLMHNLEHGGVVLSYKCKAASKTGECAELEKQLVDLANAFGENRIIVTPDPTQSSKLALRTWRWTYESDCLDETSALDFLAKHFRHGREDIDADPPVPFDPTTTSVPCQDLMAAPDSCQ